MNYSFLFCLIFSTFSVNAALLDSTESSHVPPFKKELFFKGIELAFNCDPAQAKALGNQLLHSAQPSIEKALVAVELLLEDTEINIADVSGDLVSEVLVSAEKICRRAVGYKLDGVRFYKVSRHIEKTDLRITEIGADGMQWLANEIAPLPAAIEAPTPFVVQLMHKLSCNQISAQSIKTLLLYTHKLSPAQAAFAGDRLAEEKDYSSSVIVAQVADCTKSLFEQANRRNMTAGCYYLIQRGAGTQDLSALSDKQFKEVADRILPLQSTGANSKGVDLGSKSDSKRLGDPQTSIWDSLSSLKTRVWNHLRREYGWYILGAIATGTVAGALIYYYKVHKNKKPSDKPVSR